MMATNKGPKDGARLDTTEPDIARVPLPEMSEISLEEAETPDQLTENVPAEAKAGKTTLAKAQRRQTARERMCIVTRQTSEEADLIRFVLDPSGVLIPDVKAVLPGRGAWVTAKRGVLAEAVKRKAFGRALKSEQPVLGLDDLDVKVNKKEGGIRQKK